MQRNQEMAAAEALFFFFFCLPINGFDWQAVSSRRRRTRIYPIRQLLAFFFFLNAGFSHCGLRQADDPHAGRGTAALSVWSRKTKLVFAVPHNYTGPSR